MMRSAIPSKSMVTEGVSSSSEEPRPESSAPSAPPSPSTAPSSSATSSSSLRGRNGEGSSALSSAR